MDSKNEQKFDKGMLNLIRQKLEHGSSVKDVEGMLLRAGFGLDVIGPAIKYVSTHHSHPHQKDIADNDFLPLLNKSGRSDPSTHHATPVKDFIYTTVKKVEESKFSKAVTSEIRHIGLFSGRLRRKDFIMGILFFFGLGFVFFSIITTYLQVLVPNFWDQLVRFVETDQYGVWLISIPFIFAPITLMVISLITRRLHNLGLPGWMSWLYLLAFLTPYGPFGRYALIGMYVVLATLFVVLISKKGLTSPNEHGKLPSSEGSIFSKIFGYEHSEG